jgi:hypothetical protein
LSFMKETEAVEGQKVKIVYYDLEDNLAVENVWTDKEGEYHRIKNIPAFAYNLAYNDLISVENDNDELYFDSLIEPSGHSTVQIIIYSDDDVEEVKNKITDLKCSWEGTHIRGYIAVDVPEEVDYKIVKQYLDELFKEKKLDYKEACLAHQV